MAFYEIEIASQLCLSGYVLITVKYNKKTHNVNFSFKIDVFFDMSTNSFNLIHVSFCPCKNETGLNLV